MALDIEIDADRASQISVGLDRIAGRSQSNFMGSTELSRVRQQLREHSSAASAAGNLPAGLADELNDLGGTGSINRYSAVITGRKVAEHLAMVLLPRSETVTLFNMIKALDPELVGMEIISYMHLMRVLGNDQAHGETRLEDEDLVICLQVISRLLARLAQERPTESSIDE